MDLVNRLIYRWVLKATQDQPQSTPAEPAPDPYHQASIEADALAMLDDLEPELHQLSQQLDEVTVKYMAARDRWRGYNAQCGRRRRADRW